MAKLSVIIPSRNERFLIPTIEDVFRNARGEVEVIAVLEGYYPEGWQEVVAKYPSLHTIHHGEAKGMRPAINAAAASATSRGAKYLMKLDAHCSVGEGFDEILKADCDKDWVVIPRRKRLDPETWTLKDVGKPDIDYHYLSFPDDPKDFGGPGLNGKVWDERIRQRLGKPEYEIDDEMASQGSGWFMHASYFTQLELMDDSNYGPFWNESQEILCKAWLSGGRGVINKKTHYAHWHKGKSGRGYTLNESWLTQGATFTKKWLFNEAWAKQTLPFKTLIERFWPVPSWPENWEELVYGAKGKGVVVLNDVGDVTRSSAGDDNSINHQSLVSLKIHSAHYGIDFTYPGLKIDITETLQSLVQNDSLDVVVTNDSLKVGNPFRGQKKKLRVTYSYDGGEEVTIEREERDWLIIGQALRCDDATGHLPEEKIVAGLKQGILEPELVMTDEGLKEVAVFVENKSARYVKVEQSMGEVDLTIDEDGVHDHLQEVVGDPRGGFEFAEPDLHELRKIAQAVAPRLVKHALAQVKSAEKHCPYCGERLGLVDGKFPIHPKSRTVALKEVNPLICKGSTKKYESLEVAQAMRDPSFIQELKPMSAVALTDLLIRRFQIPSHRLRGPMPIEIPTFHRNDLAKLFAELGFNKGAEIGVAEGNYSEVLCKANPNLELLCVDPWHAYSGNPQNKSKEKNEYAYNEAKRKLEGYNVKLDMRLSMEAVMDVADRSLDFVYLDAHHSYPFIMSDLILWSQKVRSGGIVSGDDVYRLNEKWGAGPMEAIYDYTCAMRINLWFLINAHKSTDFFFVKS